MLVVAVFYRIAVWCANHLLVLSSAINFVHELFQDKLLTLRSQSVENLAKCFRIVYIIPFFQVNIVGDVLYLLICENTPKLVLHAVLQTQVKVRLQKQSLKSVVLQLVLAAMNLL